MRRPRTNAGLLAGALALIALAAPTPPARASFETINEIAHIRMAPNPGTGIVATNSFSALIWIRPTDPASGAERAVLTITGAFELRLDGQGRPLARLRRAASVPTSLTVTAPEALVPGEWALVVASFDRTTGELWIGSACESKPFASASASISGFIPGPVSGDTFVARAETVLAVEGVYAELALRREAIAPADGAAVWQSRRFHAPFDMNTVGDGGLMTGADNCWWMVNHCVATLPTNGLSVASSQGDRAAVIGGLATTKNFAIFNRAGPALPDNFSMVRPVLAADSCRYVSHHDGGNAGFFVRQLPSVSEDLSQPRVAAVAPRARRLVTGPAGPWKVMISGNSRATKRFDGSGLSPGNYIHGFAWLRPESTSGVLNAPMTTSKTPWFGLDTGTNASYMSGAVTSISQMDASRFWTGSVADNGVGPGAGLLLPPGSGFSLRCKPEGLIRADRPLLLRAHAFACPGASTLLWAPNKFDRQGAFGADAEPEQPLDLDTTTGSRTFDPGAGDAYRPSVLTLSGDARALAVPGHTVVHGDSIAVITSVDFNQTAPGATTIILEFPFSAPPANGAALLFGPWRYETIEYTWPALDAGDPAVWRGLRFRVGDGSGQGAVLFAMDAWRPDVDGFVWGVAGWGGNGYQPQINTAAAASIPAWMALFSPDVWLQTFAQQDSTADSMTTWATLVRGALPHADLVWLGDMTHAATFTPWHLYILEHGAAMNAPSISLLMHPELGDQNELFADGLRADTNHVSQRGNERLAELWLEALDEVALTPALPGDADGDGAVGFSDLNVVLSNYNAVGQGVPGDLDFDNRVDFADLNIVLGGYGLTAPPQ